MSKKPIVVVEYGGEVLKSMSFFTGAENGVVDLRWNPFIIMNDERLGAPKVIVKVNNWVMSHRFRSQCHEERFHLGRFDSAEDVNTYLTILNHFGFEADYNRNFVQRIEPMIAEVMLQAFKVDVDARISPRAFHGEIMERSTFYSKFDDFLVKYGM
uniref:Uncharacterized protein n=1 Tax=Burkholderia phage vB_BgluM-SURPRISE13 TaxID=3159457 RepID=A0AAU7PF92_9VIRU